jgi:tetratricopeptide (TPR) repeat protein
MKSFSHLFVHRAALAAWLIVPQLAAGESAPAAASLIDQATRQQSDGNLEDAARTASAAIEIDPKNVEALDLRGSIYLEEKLWDRAERDYTTLNTLSPDPAYQYKLGQIRFLQKDYGNARPRFAALQSNARLGDLATYKVFLCDLLGGHESFAIRDLNALPSTNPQPSYIYGHVAWDLYHNQRPAADLLLAQANHLFSSTINDLYIGALIDAQRFHPAMATFATRDGRTFNQARVFLESDGLRTLAPQGWVTLPLDQLPDDLSPFPEEIRAGISRRRTDLAAAPTAVPTLSFTTKAGKSYQQVRWTLEETGIDVLTAAGWITVPFDQLPTDLSSFPPALQQSIEARRMNSAAPVSSSIALSFTTRAGKSYDGTKASLSDDGVRLLTEGGWITVPFADLPVDLAPFPAGWRARIQAGATLRHEDATGMKVISFTSTKGRRFDDVRASLGGEGLRVLSSDGWIVVTYDQVPTDLSAFPEAWRDTIASRQKHLRETGANRN